MKKKLAIAALIAASALGLAACVKQVDARATNAQPVGGVGNLSRFCDGPVLIYYSDWDASDDQYEWFWPGGCEYTEGRWRFVNTVPTGAPIPNGDSTDDN
ncbi:hypothetical protein [Actinokineospora enzanensis]|uniref:hypothetical protein n=1 Tax=Actinokineospora enzanensis TaxID=155975 RepID=UPI00037ECB88|nr:hypothetical protein [Actinokineospora enzanensis]